MSVYSRRPQSPVATPCDAERSSSSSRPADDDITSDDGETEPDRQVKLMRSDQLGFGFSAADERPTTIRSVIKGSKRTYPITRGHACTT